MRQYSRLKDRRFYPINSNMIIYKDVPIILRVVVTFFLGRWYFTVHPIFASFHPALVFFRLSTACALRARYTSPLRDVQSGGYTLYSLLKRGTI